MLKSSFAGDDGEEDAGDRHGERDPRGVPGVRQGADRSDRRQRDATHLVQLAGEAEPRRDRRNAEDR